MSSLRNLLIVLFLAFAAAGCGDNGRVTPPDTDVIFVHAAPTYGQLNIYREQRREDSVNFRASTRLTFGVDQYDFHIDADVPGGFLRVADLSQVLSADTEDLIVLAETGGVIEPLVLPIPKVDENSLDSSVGIVHAASTLGAVDVYLEEPGTDITQSSPVATLSYGDASEPFVTRFGDHDITLTEPGNPANVILAAPTESLSAGRTNAYVIVDGARTGTAPYYVMLSRLDQVLLADKNIHSQLRVINAASDRAPRNVYLDQDYTSAFLSDIPFGAVSESLELPADVTLAEVTPTANSGIIDTGLSVSADATNFFTLLVSGDAGALTPLIVTDEFRSISGVARLRIYNGINNYADVEVFILEAGSDLEGQIPLIVPASPSTRTRDAYVPSDAEVTVRDLASSTILADHIPITLEDGGVYTIVLTDNADNLTADVSIIDENQ